MTIKEFMEVYPNLTTGQVRMFLLEHAGEVLSASVLGRVFEKLYIGADGKSAYVDLQELIDLHPSFTLGNGGGWCRSDTGYLGSQYVMRNMKQKGKITKIASKGFKEDDTRIIKYRKVPAELLDEMEEAYECYCAMAAALEGESERTLGREIYRDAMKQKHIYEMQMLTAIRRLLEKKGSAL